KVRDKHLRPHNPPPPLALCPTCWDTRPARPVKVLHRYSVWLVPQLYGLLFALRACGLANGSRPITLSIMADSSGGGEIDPTVERLRLCVEEGKEIRTEEDGVWLGDEFFLPKDTICECPWVVKDAEAQEMVLERARLATLVLLVQSPAKNTWSQYMQASKRARIPALSLWSFKSAQRFFSLGASASPSPRRSNRPAGGGAAR
ncbi:unnamed protein product, partial [Scytosiphon promiscuus]